MTSDELKLVSTDDLLNEIASRFYDSIFAGHPRVSHAESEKTLRFFRTGTYASVIGLCELIKHDALKHYETRNP